MKMRVVCLMLAAAMAFTRADVPDATKLGPGETVDSFDWTHLQSIDGKDVRLTGINYSFGKGPSTPAANIERWGKDAADLNLRTVGPAICSRVTHARYAIVSHMVYQNVPAGSYLEMVSVFSPADGGPEFSFSSRTEAESGPAAKIEGSDDGRDVVLPFDAKGIKGKLVRIELNIHLTGPAVVRLGDTNLVQYPDDNDAATSAGKLNENSHILPATGQHAPDVATLGLGEMVEGFGWAGIPTLSPKLGGVDLGWNWWPAEGIPAVMMTVPGNEPVDVNLRTLGPGVCARIRAGRYAIVGRMGYGSVPKGSYLEMRSCFVPEDGGAETVYSSRTMSDSGPNAQIEGTESNRPLALTFDSTGIKGKLIRIEFNLHLAGHGELHMSQTSLMQYPPGLTPAAGTLPQGETVYEFPKQEILSVKNGDGTGALRFSDPVAHVTVTHGSGIDAEAPFTITYDGSGVQRVRLLSWPRGDDYAVDNVRTHHYALTGDVKCDGVAAGSFLEMVSTFDAPGGGAPAPTYFTRTLADSGPMGKLEGTADWRPFDLPFDSTSTKTGLHSLEMFLNFTGPGKVSVRNLKLVQYPDTPGAAPVAPAPASTPAPVVADKDGVLWQLETWWKMLGLNPISGLDLQTQDNTNKGPNNELQVTYSATEPVEIRLLSLPALKSATGSYTLTGEVRCDEGWPGGYLQYSSVMLGSNGTNDGPLVELQPDKAWHAFNLTINPPPPIKNAEQTCLLLDLTGPGIVHFRNLKLLQAPAAAPVAPDDPRIVEKYSWRYSNLTSMWWGNYDADISVIWQLVYPKVSATHFAFVGEAFCDKTPSRSLDVVATFLPEKPDDSPISLVLNNEKDGVSQAKLKGTNDWQPFVFPFDASGIKTRLTVLRLQWDEAHPHGPANKVYFRNLRLVEYPAGFPSSFGTVPKPHDQPKALAAAPAEAKANAPTAAPAPAAPSAATSKSWQLDWISCLVGIALVLGVGALAASISILRRLVKRRAHEKELRRIESIDG